MLGIKTKQGTGETEGIPTFCRVTREDLFVNMTFERRLEKNSDSRTMQIFKQEHFQQRQKQMQVCEAEVYLVYYKKHKEASDAGAKGAK